MSSPFFIYVDVGRTETYTETGTEEAPYKTLQAALGAHLTEGNTQNTIFLLKPGTYDVGSGIDIQQTSKTQNFCIKGLGPRDAVTIKCTDITTDVLYFRNFKNVFFRNLTITNGKYGIYTRDTTSVHIFNCSFWKLGSKTFAQNHDFGNTQAEQAARWAGDTTSNGGAVRLRNAYRIRVEQNYIWRCLRGIRVQEIGHGSLHMPSRICDNQIIETMESAIYLAASSYGYNSLVHVSGTRHMQVFGNRIQKPYNCGVLVIGSQFSEIHSNVIHESANAGIMQWSSCDCVYKNNSTVTNCSTTGSET